jgi:Short C-terminal domain
MQDQKLMDYFKFTEEDLQANRNGVFSNAQKQNISANTPSVGARVRCSGFIFIVAFGLLGGAAYLFIRSKADAAIPISMIVLGIIVLVVAIVLSRGLFAKGQYKLAKAQGKVNIIKAERAGMNHTSHYFAYELHIGGEEFDVGEDLADIMMQGDEYAIYYDMWNNDFSGILSAELLSKASASASDPQSKLEKLKEMLISGSITQQEFEQKKKEILEKM